MISDHVCDNVHYQMKIINTVIPLTLFTFDKPQNDYFCNQINMLHFIRVYTVCKGKKDLHTKEYTIS